MCVHVSPDNEHLLIIPKHAMDSKDCKTIDFLLHNMYNNPKCYIMYNIM